MKIKSANLTINVSDLDKSIAFYQSIGLTLKERWGEHYAQLTASGIVIGLHPSKQSEPGTDKNLSIGFTAENFGTVNDELIKVGIKTKYRNEKGGEFLHFEDPDGTSLYFINPKW